MIDSDLKKLKQNLVMSIEGARSKSFTTNTYKVECVMESTKVS